MCHVQVDGRRAYCPENATHARSTRSTTRIRGAANGDANAHAHNVDEGFFVVECVCLSVYLPAAVRLYYTLRPALMHSQRASPACGCVPFFHTVSVDSPWRVPIYGSFMQAKVNVNNQQTCLGWVGVVAGRGRSAICAYALRSADALAWRVRQHETTTATVGQVTTNDAVFTGNLCRRLL